ncbi:hypothetical protein B0H10DRAFT_2202261 [Mycena sp. CBHHK59/15]|nr:hypothetical protein B0H10DRAFT_2202261 [Mycena sp. CBHHK59/15]
MINDGTRAHLGHDCIKGIKTPPTGAAERRRRKHHAVGPAASESITQWAPRRAARGVRGGLPRVTVCVHIRRGRASALSVVTCTTNTTIFDHTSSRSRANGWLGLHAVPVTGTDVVSTGVQRARPVTQRSVVLANKMSTVRDARGWTENAFKHIKKKWVKYNMKTPGDSDDDEEPGVLIQVCGDPDCSMEGDLPMIQCMGPGCSSQYHRCCAGIQESETEDAVEEWFCDEDCQDVVYCTVANVLERARKIKQVAVPIKADYPIRRLRNREGGSEPALIQFSDLV